MKENLLKLCEDFITNRDAVKEVFRSENSHAYPLCANIFCVRGMLVREEELRQCRDILKKQTGAFSPFRGKVSAPIAAMLAAGEFPIHRMEQATANYEILRGVFPASDYLALTAFLLTDMDVPQGVPALAERARRLFDLMKKKHPFLSDPGDSVFAVLMARSARSDGDLMKDLERCYTLLRRKFSAGNAAQGAAEVLCLSSGRPEDKVAQVSALYDALRLRKKRYGKESELAFLAALSISETDITTLAEEICQVDEFLSIQKGYTGMFGVDKRSRLMQAAMIVSDEHAPRQDAEISALAATIAIIAAEQAAAAAAAASAAH